MPYFSVKNLGHYQHYKHRRPTWVKLYRSTMESYDFGRLQDASKWLALGMILLASETANHIPDDAIWIQRRLQMTTQPDFAELLSAGFVERYDDASKLLASCYQNGVTETETETEEETEEETEQLQLQVKSARKKRAPLLTRSRQTWLTAPAVAWDAINGAGSFPFGKAAKFLAPLHKAGHTPEKIAAHLMFYLEMFGDLKGHLKRPEDRGWGGFKPDLARFAETFDQWNPNGAVE